MSHLQTLQDKSDRYIKIKKIGEGTFGVVYLGVIRDNVTSSAAAATGGDIDEDDEMGAVDESTRINQLMQDRSRIVAIKKIRNNDVSDGIHFTALREIKLLQELKQENVLELIDVYIHKGSLHIVYEYAETDLDNIIRDTTIALHPQHIKSYMKQILEGVNACHKNWMMHRDLKPGNLLVTSDGIVKLGDFGLAVMFGSPDRKYTPKSVTRWYRPPELLYGADVYGPAVDIWSVGCIFAELMLRVPYFPGDSDLDQLGKIFAALGTPSEEQWPGMKSLPDFIEFEEYPATPFKLLFTAASDDAIDLLSKMLVFDPALRISAEEALRHPYFHRKPGPAPYHTLPMPKSVLQKKKDNEQLIRSVFRALLSGQPLDVDALVGAQSGCKIRKERPSPPENESKISPNTVKRKLEL